MQQYCIVIQYIVLISDLIHLISTVPMPTFLKYPFFYGIGQPIINKSLEFYAFTN